MLSRKENNQVIVSFYGLAINYGEEGNTKQFYLYKRGMGVGKRFVHAEGESQNKLG